MSPWLNQIAARLTKLQTRGQANALLDELEYRYDMLEEIEQDIVAGLIEQVRLRLGELPEQAPVAQAPEAEAFPQYYSQRRLNPYLGVIQVVDLGEARAYSATGKGWQLRLVREDESDRLAGVWDEAGGLRAVHEQAPLIRALRARPALPFPAGDRYELWLLRKDSGLPLALLQSRRWARDMDTVTDPTWRPFLPGDNSFTATSLGGKAAQGRQYLERQINQAVNPLPYAQWFERHADGSGTGYQGLRVPEDWVGRRLPAEVFPELLVDESWAAPEEAALVEDFHNWIAPRLLAHQNLSRATRARLERAACRRPRALLESYPMIPEVLDRDSIKVALVEGKLMQTR